MKKKILLIPLLFLILLFIGYSLTYYFGTPRIKGHLYLGDHITLNMDVNNNGKVVSIPNNTVTCEYDSENVRVSLNGNSFSVRGGSYGIYTFSICIPSGKIEYLNNDLTISIVFMTWNWPIVNINFNMNITTDGKSCSGITNIHCEYNDGTSTNINQKFNSIENNSMVYFVGW